MSGRDFLRSELIRWFRSTMELLFPGLCVCCRGRLADSRLPMICHGCLTGVREVVRPWCSCCGQPFAAGEDHLCGNCLNGFFFFDLARSAFQYKGVMPELVMGLKYKGIMTALASISSLAQAGSGYAEIGEPDLVLPVPLSRARLQGRGFNQAMLLTIGCFPQWRQRIEVDLLLRQRHTVAQSRLSGSERRKNLKNAFEVKRPDRVSGKRVLLVDDVFTTGTTVNECARQLYQAGADRIEVFTLARVV